MTSTTQPQARNPESIMCEDPQEFLEKTSPWGSVFRDETAQFTDFGWVFRGQCNAEWRLRPKAFREDTEMLDGPLSRGLARIRHGPDRLTNFDQAYRELCTLRAFYLLADEHGLSIPEDSQMLREKMLGDPHQYLLTLAKTPRGWPPSNLLSLMALAQHHGLPTRLLDWTRSMRVATYFACVGAAREWHHLAQAQEGLGSCDARLRRLEDGTFGVWALFLGPVTEGPNAVVRTVTAPRAGNVNLHAQQGLFTLQSSREPIAWSEKADYTPLETAIRLSNHSGVVLRHFQIPLRYAPRLLTLLARERETGARYFPGFDGVVKAVQERKWRLPAGKGTVSNPA